MQQFFSFEKQKQFLTTGYPINLALHFMYWAGKEYGSPCMYFLGAKRTPQITLSARPSVSSFLHKAW